MNSKNRNSVQRKQGVGLFKPVSWNKGRRFTSPGPGVGESGGTGGTGGQRMICEVR